MKNGTPGNAHEDRWLAPVWVRHGEEPPEAITSPKQALERLSCNWPMKRGRHYLGAKASCTAVMKKRLASDLAREAFIRASIEAQILN
ncbi:DUF982 domain-containing protein [Rhizobium sp. SAFR-030]|jgi:hypothetical protein|uniref:DUF982 domain-containing protein n=1 Tax=Rhizobium sp. SAFR-030 TaxID=3387277 RepID=UPI003F806233